MPKNKGFSLIELLVVIAIIGILASVVLVSIRSARESAYFARAQSEMKNIATALEFYLDEYGVYPDDADRDLPPGIEEFLGPGEWPDAPWPGSVYDWEAWEDPETGDEIHQISIRFCPLGQAENCHFPNQDWAEDFDYYSSVYFCLEGVCRSHINRPVDHPGYCVNCED